MSPEVSHAELKEIVERARKGSIDDFHKLYSLFSKPIYNFIWRLIGSPDEAEDLTQDTFLKVHSELGNLREAAQFKYWLYRIARNEVYQKLRRAHRTAEVSIDSDEVSFYEFLADETHGFNPEEHFLSRELDQIVTGALNSMKPKYRDVFVLAVFHSMSYEEISQIVGRSLLSVKTDIYRARLTVKQVLHSYLKRKL